jgi:glucose/arabinose dehydrogenase
LAAVAALAGNSSAQLPDIPTGSISIEVQQVASGLTSPVDMVSPHDGTNRLFIVEQPGRIRILKNGLLIPAPFLDITAQTVFGGEQGLTGLAFHPGFSDPASPGFRRFYTFATEPPNGFPDFTVPKSTPFANQIIVAEWQVLGSDPDRADPGSKRVILRIDHPQDTHHGGKLAFRPSDGYLYIATGDGGNANDVGDGHNPAIGNAQDLTTVLGKILRIDPIQPVFTPTSPDPVSANGRYRVPATNPFNGMNGLREIYAYGFRNPYRFSFDPQSDRLIVGDVGQNSIEEVDIVEIGKNYGWNRKEGSFLFNPANAAITPDPNPDPGLTNPLLEYDHDEGVAVIGGYVYRGSAVPALAGKYLFGDFLRLPHGPGRLFYGDFAEGSIHEVRIGIDPRPLGRWVKGFGEDDQHELYVLGDNPGPGVGEVLKVIPIPANRALANLSSRARVEATENGPLIGGFIVTGSSDKSVVLRAIGPSLQSGGTPLPSRLANPTLSLRDSAGAEVRMNDDWMTSPDRQMLIDLGLAPSNPAESAIVARLEPGAYTAVVGSANGSPGIGLVEIFDVSPSDPSVLSNLSTRSLVLTGDNVLIGGLIVGGTQPQRVIVRAIGPSLAAQGLHGALQNPTLELVNASGMRLAFNDNWRSDQQAEIEASGVAPTHDAESAIVRTLSPGGYTAIVRGAGNSIGVGLVEVFRLSP